MKLVRVGATALNQTPLDWDGNLARIRAVLAEAKAKGVSILCLPELCLTGYGCEDMFHAEFVHETARRCLEALLPDTRGLIVSVGLPVFQDGAVFNSAGLLCDGELAGVVAKKFLAGDGIHYEPRWFKPWPAGVRDTLTFGKRKVPFGDMIFDCGGIELGFEICEEAWVSNRPGAALALKGVDVILNPSASHFAFGKIETRKRFVTEGSRAFGVAYVYSNLLGNESGRIIFDGGALIASGGKLAAQGPRLSYRDWELTIADVDITLNRMNRARASSYNPELRSEDPGNIRYEFAFPERKAAPPPEGGAAPAEAWEKGESIKEEEFTRAVALGLFDYLRRSRSEGFTVSLSGGADSSAVTCLVAASLKLAVGQLGTKGLKEKLGYIPFLKDFDGDVGALTRALLATVYQPTENSGPVGQASARAVAQAVGADYMEWGVGEIAKAYVETVGKAIGRPITWRQDDAPLQNIQARVRAPGVWLLANIRNFLLLATSDRSEAAVGYATMDGDTCGGLSPIAGIDKAFLVEWLKWFETRGPDGVGPIPALSHVTAQSPTPELRPASAAQTAEGDLMPYPVLDVIERAFIRDKRSPAEVLEQARALFPQYPAAGHLEWVRRFFRLWCRNQWKRERYAPSFHLDDENLDPRSWCRFPILSSSLEKEIRELS